MNKIRINIRNFLLIISSFLILSGHSLLMIEKWENSFYKFSSSLYDFLILAGLFLFCSAVILNIGIRKNK